MTQTTAVTVLALSYIGLGGLLVCVAYRLATSGHPVFAAMAGAFAFAVVVASGTMEINRK